MAKRTATKRRPAGMTRAYHVSDPRSLEAFLINGRVPGENEIIVTEETALACSAVWSCVRLISETLAMLPAQVYRRDGEFKNSAPEHVLYPLLHDEPNPDMTAFSFWQFMASSLLLWGNGFAEIQRDNAGYITGIWPLLPNRIDIQRAPDKSLVYKYETGSGPAYLTAADVLHVPGLGGDGIIGYSPIRMAANAIGLSLAAEQYAKLYFQNGAVPSYVASHPQVLGPDGVAYLEKYLADRSVNRRPLILEEGIKVESLSINPVDSQLLEQRKWQRNEIAVFFRCPPSKVGGDAANNTYGNREADNASFIQESIAPWCERIEQELNRKLLRGTDYFCEFNIDGYLRGDTSSRYTAYQAADWMTVNEKRRKENLPPIDGGDELPGLQPKPEPTPAPPSGDVPADGETQAQAGRNMIEAFAIPAAEALRRMATKEAKACDGQPQDRVEAFAAKHRETLRSALEPAAVGLAIALGRQPSDIDAVLAEAVEVRAARLVVDAIGGTMAARVERIEADATALMDSIYQALRGK